MPMNPEDGVQEFFAKGKNPQFQSKNESVSRPPLILAVSSL